MSKTDVITQEIWKSVVGYEKFYEVSNIGRIRSLGRHIKTKSSKGKWTLRFLPGRVLKLGFCKGYSKIDLKAEGIKRNNASVHRLVAQCFVANPHNKPHINHINGIPSCNISTNLEWCTHKENMQHAFSTGLTPMPEHGKGDKCKASKLTEAEVVVVKRRITAGEGCRAISEDYIVGESAIREIKAGRSWGHV